MIWKKKGVFVLCAFEFVYIGSSQHVLVICTNINSILFIWWREQETYHALAISHISHFLDHAQNKARVSVGEFTRFVNMTDWKKKVKRSIITERD